MKSLEPPDIHYFRGACGWLELGNPQEALLELEHISREFQHHPDVLQIHWQAQAKLQRWEEALTVARQFIATHPDNPAAWIHQAYALRRSQTGGLALAWEALQPSAEQFPKEPIIPYNLACYAAQMGKLEDAWLWLRRAAHIGGITRIRKMALEDADLEALWEKLKHDPTALGLSNQESDSVS